MGAVITKLLLLFNDHVSDHESASRVAELAAASNRWSAGHGVFREIRGRLLASQKLNDRVRSAQYFFEEICCEAMYNASGPHDPFDSSAPFFVAEAAFRFAEAVALPAESVIQAFAPAR
jgi:hypothetical protein